MPSNPLAERPDRWRHGRSLGDGGEVEVSLDIEMVASMAPGVSQIIVYMAPNPSPWVDCSAAWPMTIWRNNSVAPGWAAPRSHLRGGISANGRTRPIVLHRFRRFGCLHHEHRFPGGQHEHHCRGRDNVDHNRPGRFLRFGNRMELGQQSAAAAASAPIIPSRPTNRASAWSPTTARPRCATCPTWP